MQPEEVLEPMPSAPRRDDTVRAVPRYRGEGATIEAFSGRFLGREARRRAPGSGRRIGSGGSGGSSNGPSGWRVRTC